MEATSLPGQSPGPPEILVPNSSLQVPEVEAGGGDPGMDVQRGIPRTASECTAVALGPVAAGTAVGAPRDAQWGHGRRDLQLDSSPTRSWGAVLGRREAEAPCGSAGTLTRAEGYFPPCVFVRICKHALTKWRRSVSGAAAHLSFNLYKAPSSCHQRLCEDAAQPSAHGVARLVSLAPHGHRSTTARGSWGTARLPGTQGSTAGGPHMPWGPPVPGASILGGCPKPRAGRC